METNATYKIKAMHIAEKLKLKDLRDRFTLPVLEFSNYEIIVKYAENSYLFAYNYGSIVFFNVPDELQEKELGNIQEYRAPSEVARTSDVFLVEKKNDPAPVKDQVFFDRVVVGDLSFAKIKMTCMLVAESTALEYYEILTEGLLEKAATYSRRLENEGKSLEGSEDFIRFIGRCLSTKQEILANLYIVDSPDETWDSVELDRLYNELKRELEIDIRYRALEQKIQIVQESLEIIVDLSKTRRANLLEIIIIALIAFSILLEFMPFVKPK